MRPFVHCKISCLDHSEVRSGLKVACARLILAAISPTACPLAVKDVPRYLNDETYSKGSQSMGIVPQLNGFICAESTLVDPLSDRIGEAMDLTSYLNNFRLVVGITD